VQEKAAAWKSVQKSAMKSSSKPSKHIPERTCIACREVRPKRELVRIVRTPENGVFIDEKGKMAGRGAYLCRTKRCWERGLKGNRIEVVLHAALSHEDRERLESYRAAL
jgi:predicted RNA-binding protein YlxR (DUF448 family)